MWPPLLLESQGTKIWNVKEGSGDATGVVKGGDYGERRELEKRESVYVEEA